MEAIKGLKTVDKHANFPLSSFHDAELGASDI